MVAQKAKKANTAKKTAQKAKRAAKPGLLSHVDEAGRIAMVDVSQKDVTARLAVARGRLRCSLTTQRALLSATTSKKGEALVTAKVAGILAAKQTGALIPLCHPVPLDDVAIAITADKDGFVIEASARCTGRTGVEMEALVAVTVCGLTLYDMGKAMERTMELTDVRLMEKRGGKSGHWVRPARGNADGAGRPGRRQGKGPQI